MPRIIDPVEIENCNDPANAQPGEDSARILKARNLDLRSRRADGFSTATIIVITLTAVVALIFLLIWAFTKAQWSMIGLLICGALILVLTVVLLVVYPIALILKSMARKAASGAARRSD